MIIYDQASLSFFGTLAAENITIETGLEHDDQDVMTLGGDQLGGTFRGTTPSPMTRTVKSTFALPPGGFEFPFEDWAKKRTVVTIAVELKSGKKMTSKGFVRNVSVSAGVGKSIEVSLEFKGEPSLFE